jgi:hypothetical protein
MRKLRLIKPWRLRTVRQHAGRIEPVSNEFQPCSGPEVCHEELRNTRLDVVCIRFGKTSDARCARRLSAPAAAELSRVSTTVIR